MASCQLTNYCTKSFTVQELTHARLSVTQGEVEDGLFVEAFLVGTFVFMILQVIQNSEP